MPVIDKDILLNHGYRINFLVENKVVIEMKTVDARIDVHTDRILTDLKLGNYA